MTENLIIYEMTFLCQQEFLVVIGKVFSVFCIKDTKYGVHLNLLTIPRTQVGITTFMTKALVKEVCANSTTPFPYDDYCGRRLPKVVFLKYSRVYFIIPDILGFSDVSLKTTLHLTI